MPAPSFLARFLPMPVRSYIDRADRGKRRSCHGLGISTSAGVIAGQPAALGIIAPVSSGV